MCGIAGIYGRNRRMEGERIARMTGCLAHRGPDDEGYVGVDTLNRETHHLTGRDSAVDGERIETFDKPVNLFLGHRRLSILDPSPLGHQPMSYRDETLWVVYNGEIYNYIELKEDLKKKGHEFRTHTDTEVLLAAYAEWGEDCLSRFNGMWSFVLYDKRKNILFGARDRFGVKPFYYYRDPDVFAFASEIKALTTLPFTTREVNPRAVFDYLVFGFLELEEEGFWKNIFELQPSFAFTLDLSSNVMRKWRYYDLQYTDQWEKFNEKHFSEYKRAVRERIFEAVTLRLRSDVPVGTCLSGGIDSSTIVCIINKLLEKETIVQVGERQKVFTASYRNNAIDESGWAQIAVEHTKAAWHRTYPNAQELLVDLEDLAYTQDIPFGSTSIYAQYRVMKIARESGIKVLLDGQGGDEVFTGYQSYHGAFFFELLKHLDFGGLVEELRGISNAPIDRKTLLKVVMKIIAAGKMPFFLKRKSLRSLVKENDYISTDFWDQYDRRIEAVKNKAKMSVNQMLYEYMTGFNLKTLLRYEDRNSMRFSIEARTPFSDDVNLINYIFQIPSIYKIHGGWSKYLLREAANGILPDEIRFRKDKIGFATPEFIWLNELKNDLKTYISDGLDGYIDTPRLLRDWDVLMSNQTKTGITIIWRFINFAVWKKVYAL